MPATNAAATFWAAATIGEATTDFNAANAYIGVGDSTTVFATSQTDLQASTNKARKGMNSTFPSRSGATITLQATFLEADAVFHWQEWGTFNGSSGGTMLNRLVQDLGTKPNTEQWRLQVQLGLSV